MTGQPIGETYQAVTAYQEGWIGVEKDGLWGYLSPTTGNLLGDGTVWESAQPFTEGKAAVSQKGLYGFIDTAGTVVIALQYSQAGAFSEGLAGVRAQKRWGVINAQGQMVLKPTYAGIKTFQNGLCAVQKGNVWGLINTSGEVVLRIKYSEIGDFDPVYHRAWIRLNKLWGLVSATGDVVLKPSWGKHDEFNGNTLCRVAYQNRYGYIDSSGKIRITNAYTNAAPFRADYGGVTVSKGELRYLNKSQRGFNLSGSVPVECLCGFIESRAITETERPVATPLPTVAAAGETPAPTDPANVALVEIDRTIAYALYDAQGNPIAVPTYAAKQE
ncbi:MAG TPA: WG repeat-containing protein [Candidatus Limiplasma sp.]|nr:WG repeat-containing protein [Candidatus Limiplasma sp.]